MPASSTAGTSATHERRVSRMWPVWAEMGRERNDTDFRVWAHRLSRRERLAGSHVGVTMVWMCWVVYNILSELISPVFLNS